MYPNILYLLSDTYYNESIRFLRITEVKHHDTEMILDGGLCVTFVTLCYGFLKFKEIMDF